MGEMRPTPEEGSPRLPESCEGQKEYVGFVWIGEEPGLRVSVLAADPAEARQLVESEHGVGHVISLWSEDDANRER